MSTYMVINIDNFSIFVKTKKHFKMKKILHLLAFISIIMINAQQNSTFTTAQKFLDSGGIICDFIKIQGIPIKTTNIWYKYIDGKVLRIEDGTYTTFPAKLDRTYIEQGLFIEEYIPTNHLNKAEKRIFKFCYEENSKEPIVVVEISYFTATTYRITKCFTKKWADLTNYKGE